MNRTGHPVGDVSVATERDYQRTVIDAAKMFGWRVHHARPAWTKRGYRTPITGHAGFPDLVLAHPNVGVLFVELKYSTKLTDDQQRWGDVLTQAGADWRELRVPDGLDQFCQYLADITRKAVS
jgi:VRR-NUC domain